MSNSTREWQERVDSAYQERDRLVAALSKIFPAHLSRHDQDDPDWDREWMNIVCIHLPAGQVTWHIAAHELPQFNHLFLGASHWDGHDTPEKYRRLEQLWESNETAVVPLFP